MENSPFNRSGMTARTPPPSSPAVTTASTSATTTRPFDNTLEVISTPEIHNWMTTIEQYLNEVCTLVSEGKMNSEQKLRVSNLCRKVGSGTSHLAVQYQALKAKAMRAHSHIHTLQDQVDISQRISDLKISMQESVKPAPVTSFADMVKKGNNTFIQPSNVSSVTIYPSDKLKSSEETKMLVQTLINPEQMKLHVRGLRKIRNGGVIISTDSSDDIVKLKDSVQLTNSGLTVGEPQKKKPRVVIIGVPSTMKETDVLTCLYHQNLADKLQDSSLEKFLETTKLSHKTGKRETETCNYVLEVTPAIRKALVNSERVFVNWTSCYVRDFTLVTRCYKCQQYGHAAKSCREEVSTCGHCGDNGHNLQECTKKAQEPKCATCLKYKKPHSHATGALDCPAKLMAEKRYINSIDYGGA